MDYKSSSIWIYSLLMILLFTLTISDRSWVLLLALIAVPGLLIWQALSVLKSKETSDKNFEQDWYDNP